MPHMEPIVSPVGRFLHKTSVSPPAPARCAYPARSTALDAAYQAALRSLSVRAEGAHGANLGQQHTPRQVSPPRSVTYIPRSVERAGKARESGRSVSERTIDAGQSCQPDVPLGADSRDGGVERRLSAVRTERSGETTPPRSVPERREVATLQGEGQEVASGGGRGRGSPGVDVDESSYASRGASGREVTIRGGDNATVHTAGEEHSASSASVIAPQRAVGVASSSATVHSTTAPQPQNTTTGEAHCEQHSVVSSVSVAPHRAVSSTATHRIAALQQNTNTNTNPDPHCVPTMQPVEQKGNADAESTDSHCVVSTATAATATRTALSRRLREVHLRMEHHRSTIATAAECLAELNTERRALEEGLLALPPEEEREVWAAERGVLQARLEAAEADVARLAARESAVGETMTEMRVQLGEATAALLERQRNEAVHGQRGQAVVGIELGEDAQGGGGGGVHVASVIENGPADRAGIQQGDTITDASGVPVGSRDAFRRVLDSVDTPGQSMSFKVVRTVNGVTAHKHFMVVLGWSSAHHS